MSHLHCLSILAYLTVLHIDTSTRIRVWRHSWSPQRFPETKEMQYPAYKGIYGCMAYCTAVPRCCLP